MSKSQSGGIKPPQEKKSTKLREIKKMIFNKQNAKYYGRRGGLAAQAKKRREKIIVNEQGTRLSRELKAFKDFENAESGIFDGFEMVEIFHVKIACFLWYNILSREQIEAAGIGDLKGAYNVIKNQVEHIEAENAALRERLDKAITPEFKIYEDVYFIDYVNEKGYSEYTTGKPKIREAFITCVSQSTQTEFLYRLQPKDLPQEILNDSTIHDEWWDWRSFYAKEIFKTREAAEARLKEIKEIKKNAI